MEHVSLETAQKLHELGWRGECEHTWCRYYDKFSASEMSVAHTSAIDKVASYRDRIPAPTFTEIWAELPWRITITGLFHEPNVSKSENGLTHVDYRVHDYIYGDSAHYHEHPAEAAGQLLIWLIKEGHKEV